MFVVHVGMTVKAGQEQAVEKDYSGPFKEAISVQEGFGGVALLRPNDGGEYLLSIAFEDQVLQQKWVGTEHHGQVWPMMESHLVGYTVKTYTAICFGRGNEERFTIRDTNASRCASLLNTFGIDVRGQPHPHVDTIRTGIRRSHPQGRCNVL